MNTIIPTIGLQFFHRRWLDPTKMPAHEPMLFRVTRMAQGQVYYRAVDERGQLVGNPERTDVEKFDKVCGSIQPAKGIL